MGTQNIPNETDEQKAVIQYLRAYKIFHFAPTNENNTHKQIKKYAMIAEAKAKAIGKIKGTSDLFIFMPDTLLIIEMKRKQKLLQNGNLSNTHSKPSKEQITFQVEANKYPYAKAYIAYGAQDAIQIIKKYQKKQKH